MMGLPTRSSNGEGCSPEVQPWQQRLHLATYSIRDAARYAQTNTSTVSYWHNHVGKLGPALPGKGKGEPLSYLQLVEVAFVATFRNLGVSLQRIRKAREYLSQRLNVDYPFASVKLQTEGTHILLDLKKGEADSEVDLLIMADQSGQVAWKPLIGLRFAQFEYQGNLAIRWKPLSDESPVVIDPRVCFGAPAVRGIPTWALKGRYTAGEALDELAEDFGLTEHEVLQALLFEGVHVAA